MFLPVITFVCLLCFVDSLSVCQSVIKVSRSCSLARLPTSGPGCVNNFNFLGLIINKHLNWNNHIDHISLKISRVIGILARLRHTVPIDVLLLLYNSFVLPHINYSLLVWRHNPF